MIEAIAAAQPNLEGRTSRTHPSAEAEMLDLVRGDLDRTVQLRTLLRRVLDDGRALEGVDVKAVRRQPEIYELIFDYRGQRWRLYLADPPGHERLQVRDRASTDSG